MKYIALAVLPLGTQPGELFEEPEEIGHVFVLAGAARVATEDDLHPDKPKSKRTYRRRDLVAETP